MTEELRIRACYEDMYSAMISKDPGLLAEVLDDSFVLVHMTGMRQDKREFIGAVLDGTLNYYSAVHESITVATGGDTASLTGRSYIQAAVFGGGRGFWRLQQRCSLKRTDGKWKITKSIASTYQEEL